MPPNPSRARTFGLTALALIAFAANSVLCRLALGEARIDPASFTSVRLLSGVITLLVVTRALRKPSALPAGGNWASAAFLAAYAISFSFAYVSLGAGTGALILFGMVQGTMILSGVRSGERPRALEWAGLILASGGLVYLVLPGLQAPAPLASALMALAGVSWGFYSLRGRGVADPVRATAANFVRAAPFVLAVSVMSLRRLNVTGAGVLLAVASGALASGLGYLIWYAALRGLSATRAATVQLAVPLLAGVGGIVLLGETLTLRLGVAGVVVLGGIGLALTVRGLPRHDEPPRQVAEG
ncbi:MAG TPA: DMT family transporter [Planctomycetota bacterium]